VNRDPAVVAVGYCEGARDGAAPPPAET
jgi:hypothetical protein